MKILVLAPQWPDPPRQGAAIRNMHILLYLAQKHEVALLTFLPQGEVDRSRLDALCSFTEALPLPARSTARRLKALISSPLPDMAWRLHSQAMQQRVRDLCIRKTFDAIHIEGIEMGPYGLLAKKWQSGAGPQLVYDAHNAEYLLQRRAFTTDLAEPRTLARALYSLVQWRRLRSFERRLCLASERVLAVSPADATALARQALHLSHRITLLPNGVDPAYWSREALFDEDDAPLKADTLVFDGSMDFRPNVDAVIWFVQEVWPRVKARRPQAEFYIVGRNPLPAVEALGNLPGITVTGAVLDTRPWVARATVYVVPMRMGGGVRLKVLQAMAMGCAIVSTPMGAEGIEVSHNREMVLARSASDFVQSVLLLLANAPRRATLGRAAQQLAMSRYAWDVLLPALDGVYRS